MAEMDGTIERNAKKIKGYKYDKVTMLGTTAFMFSGTEMLMEVTGSTMGIKVTQIATSIVKKALLIKIRTTIRH